MYERGKKKKGFLVFLFWVLSLEGDGWEGKRCDDECRVNHRQRAHKWPLELRDHFYKLC